MNKQWKLFRYATVEKNIFIKVNKLSTMNNIFNCKPSDILYAGYLNPISTGLFDFVIALEGSTPVHKI